MAYPKLLRNRLGLTIPVFAEMIGCTAGLLSMVEIGRRNLPKNAVVLLIRLEEALKQPGNAANTATTNQRKKVLLEKHIRNRQLLSTKLVSKAEQLTKRQEQNKCLLQLSRACEAAPLVIDDEETLIQIKIAKRKAEKKILLHQKELIKVQLTLAGLEAEIQRAVELKKMEIIFDDAIDN